MADEKTVRVRLLRAYWNDKAERVDAGAEIDVPIHAALEGVECGLFGTVKAEKKKA